MLPSCWALPLRRQHTEYSQSKPALPGLSSHGMQSPSMRAKSWVHVLKTGPMVCSPRFKAQQTPSCWSSDYQWRLVVFPTPPQRKNGLLMATFAIVLSALKAMDRNDQETMNVVWTSRDISIMDCIQVSCVEVGRLQINKTLSSFSFVFRLTCNPRTGTKPSCGHKHAFSYVQLHWLIVFNLHFVILWPPQKDTYNINQHHSRIQCFPFDTCKGLPKTNHEPSPWRRSWSYVVSPKGW